MREEIPEKESIGERIRRLRKERGFNQNELADEVGVTFAWISQIEKDKATASPALLNKIALALKVPIRELIQDEEQHLNLASRLKLGEVLLETNQPDEALEMIGELEDHPDLSETDELRLRILLAECDYQQARYDQSLELLKPLVYSLEAMNYHDAHILAEIHNNIGKALFQKREFSNAFYHYRKAYEYSFRFPEFDFLSAKINYNVGMTLRRTGRSKESLPYLDRSYTYFKNNDNLKVLAYTALEQGLAYKNIKNYAKAAECFGQSKAIFQALEIKTYLAMAQHIMASEVTVKQDVNLAIKELDECIDIARSEKSNASQILYHSKLANVLLSIDKQDDAMNNLQHALNLISEHSLEKAPESMECYYVLAMYYFERQDYENSIKSALEAADICGKIGLVRSQVDALQVAIEGYKQIGNLEESLALAQLSTKLLIEWNESGVIL